MSEGRYCKNHADARTSVMCGRCEGPICPRCMVHGPVGIRCVECAQVRRLPTFEVTRPYLARAIGAGLAIAVAGGLIVSLLRVNLGWIYWFDWIALMAMGYVIAEGISAAVNRKRGRTLKFVSGGSMLVAWSIIAILGGAWPIFFGSLFGLLPLFVAFYLAINRF